jgi:hypothetical protein
MFDFAPLPGPWTMFKTIEINKTVFQFQFFTFFKFFYSIYSKKKFKILIFFLLLYSILIVLRIFSIFSLCPFHGEICSQNCIKNWCQHPTAPVFWSPPIIGGPPHCIWSPPPPIFDPTTMYAKEGRETFLSLSRSNKDPIRPMRIFFAQTYFYWLQ